ncbi:unnamed protein product [Candida verbasci]|uniref:Uncharacterized protein n=1 Tax=Candida verbasci TaxID=1227364 RepID=A0A9W4TU55_9ASCO|nr:unnamed protein product [Candida verbasci]
MSDISETESIDSSISTPSTRSNEMKATNEANQIHYHYHFHYYSNPPPTPPRHHHFNPRDYHRSEEVPFTFPHPREYKRHYHKRRPQANEEYVFVEEAEEEVEEFARPKESRGRHCHGRRRI